MSRKRMWLLVAVGAVLGLVTLWLESAEPAVTTLTFHHQGDALVGDLMLPTGPGPHPVVLLVHGDGPMPRDGFGYYRPLQAALARQGYASFSWDKPGVGASTGDWEAQSMQDRAEEVTAAAALLRQRSEIDRQRIGLWGISQAGWVMPLALARDPRLAFMITVSGAVSWEAQSLFLTRQRLQRDGYSPGQIQQALAWNRRVNRLLQTGASYQDYLRLIATAPAGCEAPMSASRWRFAARNLTADVRTSLHQVRVPVLALFGAYDRNVDVPESLAVYRRELARAGHPLSALRLFPRADHGLIPAVAPVQIDGRSTPTNLLRLLRIEVLGEDAFAPGYFDAQLAWLRQLPPLPQAQAH